MKITNFTTYAKKMNIPQKDLKVKEVLCIRDIWGCLVYLAVVQNLELEHVMAPLSLAHIYGAIMPGKKRFEKPIKRKRKITNFTAYAKKMNIPQKDLKVKEVLCTRDIWGCLVYLAVVQNLELEHVMSYPMTMAPLSLAHIYGAMNRTDKSSLMRKLEKATNQKSWTSRMLMCA